MESFDATPASFFALGYSIVSGNAGPNETDNALRTFRSFFGVSPTVLSKCWELLTSGNCDGYNGKMQPKHLLWACMLLKVYGVEQVHARMAGCSVRTFRKWSFDLIEAIASLLPDVVSIF